jgi:hypothetical protein
MYHLGLTVAFGLDHYSFRSIFFMDPSDLISDDAGGLIPGNPDIFASPTILGIPFSVGIPVYPL